MPSTPNYIKIYSDILSKHPEAKEACSGLLKKKNLSANEVIHINDLIFPKKDKQAIKFNRRYYCYDKASIIEILQYQKKNNLKNIETALHFKVSRNSITKWKKKFIP
ncbi:transposase [Chryseobacterium angstadtii]|uniref:Transposase n=1 Tax=Chryseobacterium angstadtii TaxID=558151 RepID=A0A0J7I2H4_9FLAO|nr:hypothetical protein [Chryseobacterium angstadtii]KMQ60149.1 transposase [Chryseobacterium angstadtii]